MCQQVQSGTVANTANGTQVVTITSVDTTKSILFFQTRSDSNRPVASEVRGRLASATTIEFIRATDEGVPATINIQWYLATFGSGVKVQRGEVTTAGTSNNVTITAVAALNQAFVLWSQSPDPADSLFDATDAVLGELTTTTNLQFRTGVADSSHTVSWQVVEFTSAADIKVQKGSIATMTGLTTSVAATITAVNVNKTFVLIGWQTTGAGADMGSRLLGARLTNSTTITIDRAISGSPDDITEISWQAIELKDASTVWNGTANFGAGAAVATGVLGVPEVNTLRAVAMMSSQGAGGQSMGRSPYAGDDTPGVAMATASITYNQITLTRTNTAAVADIGWSVVQFDGGTPFKVGSFAKTTGAGPVTQTIPHGLGQVPKALLVWTEGRTDETFSNASAIAFRAASFASTTGAAGVLAFDAIVSADRTPANLTVTSPVFTTVLPNELLLAHVSAGGAAGQTVTGVTGAGLTWQLVRRTNVQGGTAEIWRAFAPTTLAGVTVTATLAVAAESSITVITFSGVDPTGANGSGAIGATGSGNAAAGAPTASLTTTRNNTGVLGVGTDTATATNRTVGGGGQVLVHTYLAPGADTYWMQAYPTAIPASGTLTTINDTAPVGDPYNLTICEILPQIAGTITINVPTGTVQNDVMLASIGFQPSGATVPTPAGWTLLRRVNNAGATSNSLVTYYKVAGAAEPANYTWAFNAITGAAGGIQSFSGVDITSPIDVELGQNTASSLSHAAPTVTTTMANDMIVTSHSFASSATWTSPAGMTEAYDRTSLAAPANAGQSIEGNYVLQAAVAATGAKTAVAASPGNLDVGNAQTVALRPVTHAYFGFGMSDGTTGKSLAVSSQNGADTSNAASRLADKVLTIVQWDTATAGIVLAEADLQSWDDTNLVLNWTTNDARAYVVHYIAFGGTDLMAQVVPWTMGPAAGDRKVVGVAFQPNLVFHAYGSYLQSTASPITTAGAAFGLGAMDGEPSAGHQWATSFLSADALGTTDTQRGQQIDACIYAFDQALASQRRAHFVSMNTDGFTVNFSPSGSAVDAQVISLALAGLNGQVGSFLKSTGGAPASQPVIGVGFKPSAILLTSFQDVARAGGPVAETRFGIGASDGTTEGSSAFRDQDAVAGVSNLLAVDKTSKVFVKIDTNSTAPVIINAEADLTSMDVDGFTLNWTTNDAVQTQILYVAMAPLAVTEVRLISFDAKRYDRGVLLRWRTGYEVNNLGFNLYREVNGVRTKVNRTPIAGSGLAAARGTRVNAEQSYAFWDDSVADTAGPVLYWLEDLDFRGKSTMHGPVALMAGGRHTPANVATSADLGDLGKPATGSAVLLEHNGSPDTRVRPRVNSAAATEWDLAAQTTVKIGIRASGWYRVKQPDLVAAGLNPGVDPLTLQLFVDGAEQAMRVTGDTDGRFDPADAIEFYGTGVDTASTDTRVYWLRAGVQPGLRIAVTDTPGMLVLSEGATSFVSTLQRKDRSIYFAALKNGDTENWFGPLVSGDGTLLTLTPDHIDRGVPGAAELDVALQGVTTASDGNAGHQVGVLVNGIDVGEVDFDGQAHREQTFSVPVAALIDGENTVTLVARGGVTDLSLVDVIRLRYWHTYQADADRLRLTTNTSGRVTVGGFASATIRVVDVTDPSAAVELHGAVQPEVGGTSSVTVVPGPGPRTLFAFSESAVASPASVRANHVSSWHLPAHAHDYVVISHANFIAQVTPLADLRQQQGHHVAVIDVDDLYDEFSYGQKTPQALKDFLNLAKTTWSEAPRFVVLAGDATIDPRDYAGLGDADFVPTKQVAMTQVALEAASDDWFVDFEGTGVPAMAVGRLSVRTTDQAAAMVTKIVGYDATSERPWTKDILLVADQADDTSNFERSDDHLAALLPAGYTAHRVFRGVMGDATAHQALSDEVNAGQLIVNYVGHGSVSLWGSNGELLQNGDVAASWQNAQRLPFVVSMNCLNGLFDGIYGEESLAEALLRAPAGGAVAAWASSSVTPPAGQALLNEELFRLIFQGVYPTLGEAISAAKTVVPNSDLRRSWVFFGDPAMKLIGTPQPVPQPPFPGPVVPGDTRPRPAPGGTPVGVRPPPTPAPVLPPAAPLEPPSAAPVDPPSAAPSEPPAVVVDINALLDARGEPIRLVDFTGDGRADKMFYSADSGRWTAIGDEVAASTTRVRGMPMPVSSDRALRSLEQGVTDVRLTDPAWLVMAADLNADRRADLVFYRRDTAEWVQALTTSDGTFAFTRGSLPMPAPGAQVRIGDFNGDHRDDLLVYDPRSGTWTMGLSDGLGGFTTRDGTGPPGLRVQVADVNGDGFADIVGYDTTTGRGIIALNSLSLQFSVSAADWGRGWRTSVAHFGGTVAADLLFYNPTTGAWQAAINDGTGRFTTISGAFMPGLEIHVADLDGDGRDDAFGYNPVSGQWLTALNVSAGRFVVADGTWTAGGSIAVGDVNGDGRADVVLYDAATGVWFEWLTVGPGEFASVSGSWLPGASLIGRPR